MNEISANFRIAVNADVEEIVHVICKKFRIDKRTSRRFILSKNFVEVYKNEDYDNALAGKQDDGFLYYMSNVDFYPQERISLREQISFSKCIKQLFDSMGWKSEIIAEFEPLLERLNDQGERSGEGSNRSGIDQVTVL